jgi:HAD superfamily hydrolase (TIGR01662 family)
MAGVLGASLHSAEVDAALATYLRFYTAHPADATRWMPHAPELLAALASRGVALALVTNKTRAVTVALMDRLGVTPRFRAVVAGGDAALKPSPEPVLRALEALGVPAEKAWMVGDAVQDIEAGRAAGCTTIAVAGGFQATERLAAAAPDHLVASLADVLALVEAVRPATTGSSAPSA